MSTILPSTQPTRDEILAALNAPSNTRPQADPLGQEDFLRLLTTQLQNQDPTDPMDPKDMITDLTGFNQLEATLKLNASMDVLVNGLASLQTMQAAGLIGKSVKVEADSFEHTAGETEQLKLKVDQPLQDVTVVISNEGGLVKEIPVGTLNAEDKLISWDGTDSLGQLVADGVYKVTAYGTDERGEIQSIATIVPARITSVAIEGSGGLKLSLATGEIVSMDSVREITE
ncbi:MAG TPA: flagellar hook capping protein [Sulfurivirga caldicuralii]|nr:flagellar hook capping protein [Sulfurivirga caldicuralii]